MSQHVTNKSRRNFLKGAAYTSALSVGAFGGLTSIAFANTSASSEKSDVFTSTNINNINIMQHKMLHKESVTLFNKSDEDVMLDALHPILIERVDGSLQVKPNFIQSSAFIGMIYIFPRQQISFDIQTTGGHFSSAEIRDVSKLDGERLHCTSEHFAFNTLIPVSHFEATVT